MTEESRREWLAVAWATVGHLPADLLAIGCSAARQKCDHPSKIVPTIIAATEESMNRRRELARPAPINAALIEPPKKHVLERRGEQMTEDETEELNRILENLGACTRYRPDGSRYQVAESTRRARDNERPPPRMPTRQDYIDMGVDPDVLDRIEAEKVIEP